MRIAAAVCVTFAIWFSVAGPTHAASEENVSAIALRNDTDATIRINIVSMSDEEPMEPTTIKPRSEVKLVVPSGRRMFDLVAFRANPVRIHRISIDIPENGLSFFRMTPHVIGQYLLEDANSLEALAATPYRPLREAMPLAGAKDIAQRCMGSFDSGFGLVLWNVRSTDPAKYYRRSGDFLCAVDGTDVYRTSEIHEYFECESGWRHCRRDSNQDVVVVPPVRTSNFVDAAFRLAKQDHPDAFYAQTKTVIWLNGNRPASRLTSYFISGNTESQNECPDGYRFHYQGFCVNKADELKDDPVKGVRGVAPAKTAH